MAGGYHCHCGPLAGQASASKEEMLKKLLTENIDNSLESKAKQEGVHGLEKKGGIIEDEILKQIERRMDELAREYHRTHDEAIKDGCKPPCHRG
jgi:predicted thioredoxin/glutaredoxin